MHSTWVDGSDTESRRSTLPVVLVAGLLVVDVAIGRELGAKQVLYVQLKNTDVAPVPGGGGFSGEAVATARIVDAVSGETLWPNEGSQATDGYTVSAVAKIGQRNGANPMEVRQAMYTRLSVDIAKLFYKWKPDDDSPEGYFD